MLLPAFCVFYFFFGQTVDAANGTCMTDTRADPSNCSLFFDCDVRKSCPTGFFFDSECGFCDVARKVNCSTDVSMIAPRFGAEPEVTDHAGGNHSFVQDQRKQPTTGSIELHQIETQENGPDNNHAEAKNVVLEENYSVPDSPDYLNTTDINSINIPIIYIYGVLLILVLVGTALVYWFFIRK